jgi:hypothetical protein
MFKRQRRIKTNQKKEKLPIQLQTKFQVKESQNTKKQKLITQLEKTQQNKELCYGAFPPFLAFLSQDSFALRHSIPLRTAGSALSTVFRDNM